MATLPLVGLIFGEGRGADYARYYMARPVASDDGQPWTFTVRSNPVAPAGLGGECLFTMAYLTVRAAAGAVLRVTPIINGDESLSTAHPDGTVDVGQALVTVPQQSGSPPTLVLQTFEVPLYHKLVVGGVPVALWNPRGERCAIQIESVGEIGSGSFRVEQCELEHEVIRRSHYATFTP